MEIIPFVGFRLSKTPAVDWGQLLVGPGAISPLAVSFFGGVSDDAAPQLLEHVLLACASGKRL